jgi:hypothetical protein
MLRQPRGTSGADARLAVEHEVRILGRSLEAVEILEILV